MTTNREFDIDEAIMDIRLDTHGDENATYDLFSDHAGGDDFADDLIHYYAKGTLPDLDTLQPRTIAFLRILKHIPSRCSTCD